MPFFGQVTVGVLAVLLWASPTYAARPNALAKEAEAAVCAKLKDCGSARFRNVRFIMSKKTDGSMAPIVCGEVNAKNSYGGYEGFQPFAYYPGEHPLALTAEMIPGGAPPDMFQKLCAPPSN